MVTIVLAFAAVALVVVVAVFVAVVAAVVVAVDVALLDMKLIAGKEYEQKGNRETKKRENNPCFNNSGNAMRFVWKLECDSVKKVVCAFRSRADPGLQAAASAAEPSRIRFSDVMMI